MTDDRSVNVLVEHLFRRHAGQMLSSLGRLLGFGQIELAEEAVQDALVRALHVWPFQGVPPNPEAWLTQVARNRLLDLLRSQSRHRRKLAELEALAAGQTEADPAGRPLDGEPDDDRLAMTFACCHPALSADARVALTLQAVGGFSAAEVARAFLADESTVAQRLVRAKRFLRDERVAVAVPPAAELPARLDSVLHVLYLLFNEGYSAHCGEDLVRHDLCGEALRLGELLARRPDTALPKVHALVALMCLQASRLPARVDDAGDLLTLAEQDRSRWDRTLIQRGHWHLDRAAAGDELTAYHVEAGIAAVHAVAASDADTDWPRLVTQYDWLMRIAPSPVVALNRAVALARVAGWAAALIAVDGLRGEPALRGYYLLPATRADLLMRLGRPSEAAACYRGALALARCEPERRFLQRRLAACEAEA
jgi:RNA polymerase sigma-70 factor (ECF subfamily)